MRFGLCLPFRANVDALAVQSHLHLVMHSTLWACDNGGLGVHMSARAHAVRARNNMAQSVLDAGNEWSLWVDDDAIVPPDCLERMLAVAEQVNANAVAALCYTRREDLRPPASRFEKDATGNLVEVPFEGEGWINTTGFHCVLVHSDVIRAVRSVIDQNYPGQNAPIFQEPIAGGTHVGEDRFFWAVAEKSGALKLWQTRLVEAGHLLSVTMTSKTRPHLLAMRTTPEPEEHASEL